MVVDGIKEKIMSNAGSSAEGGDWKGGGTVKEWIEEGLRFGGVFSATAENIEKMYGRVMQESGGDPNAQNNWDSNAQAGTPSKGLVQIIKGTWESWRNSPGPDAGGFEQNWMNPVKSVAVSSRYMKGAYGYLVGSNGQGYRGGGVIPGMKGMEKLVLGHAGERVLPIPAVDAFDRLAKSIVLWSREAPRVSTPPGTASRQERAFEERDAGEAGGGGVAGSAGDSARLERALKQHGLALSGRMDEVARAIRQTAEAPTPQRITNSEELADALASAIPMVTESQAFKRQMDRAMARSMNDIADTMRARR